MGWDITYHPITPEELQTWYFQAIQDARQPAQLIQAFPLDDFNADKLQQVFVEGRKTPIEGPWGHFERTHGFFAAIVASFLRDYTYLRGAAFSFVLEKLPDAVQYTTAWREIVPPQWQGLPFANRLTENYNVGAYLSPDNLRQLRADYATRPELQAAVDSVFGEGTLPLFWQAVDEALQHNRGLLEATEVIEPTPQDLSASTGYGDVQHCRPEGLHLYAEIAQRQLQEALRAFGESETTTATREVLSADPDHPEQGAKATRASTPEPKAATGWRRQLCGAYVRSITRNYRRFDGRMHRAEFWWFALCNFIIFLAFMLFGGLFTEGPLSHSLLGSLYVGVYGLYLLAMVVPTLAAEVRRLHDTGLSGWLVLLNLIPYLGGLIVLILLAMPAKPSGAKYGAYHDSAS
ncbi:DUF805 domain-containing protein [Acidithiobacillus thiooxidans]|uniref:DUF805 domain-containing protein n=1 Tax=Acidithiobacillus thiooxidans TaxID=930 RepID=UPI003565AF2D|nr:DUF805 domain-containing protein [Acidithiobacillus sp.]